MRQVVLTLIRQDSDSTLFTFKDEETNEIVLSKPFDLYESTLVSVRDDFSNFVIESNGSTTEYDFTSSSVE